jgi:hypothetical protein
MSDRRGVILLGYLQHKGGRAWLLHTPTAEALERRGLVAILKRNAVQGAYVELTDAGWTA